MRLHIIEPPLTDEEIKYLRYMIRKCKDRERDLAYADTIPTGDDF
jgi:hypothetical protein